MRAAAINVVAAAVSTAVLAAALSIDASPHVATMLRLLVAFPILFVGYTRFLSLDPMRVGFAIGAATGLKLAVEPVLVALFPDHAVLAPLVADLGYGPLVTYVMLRTAAPSVAFAR